MAIAYGGGAGLGFNSGTTLTYTNFTTTGSDILLVVGCMGTGGNNITDVKFNGVSLTPVVTGNSLGRYLYIWIYQNCPATTANIVITANAGQIWAQADYWTGVASSGNPEDTSVVGSGGSPRAIVVDTTTDNDWGVAYARSFGPTHVGAGSGTVLRHADNSDPYLGILDSGGPKTPAGALTLNVTGSGGIEVIAIAIIPAAGGSHTNTDGTGESHGSASGDAMLNALADADGEAHGLSPGTAMLTAIADATGEVISETMTTWTGGEHWATATGEAHGVATVHGVAEDTGVIVAGQGGGYPAWQSVIVR